MAFTISYVIQAVNSFTPSANQIANSVRRLRDRFRDLTRTVGRASERLRNLGSRMTVGLTAPLGIFAGAALKAAANLETLEVGFQSILGSAGAAKDMMQSLTDFTAKTPFQLEGVAKSAKLLLGFGVESGKIEETLTNLGNIASASNTPIGDLALIFGKVKANGKLLTDELNQLAERGIPVTALLAKKFGKSQAIIRKAVGNSEVSFQDLQDVILTLNKKGGIAHNAMANQSKTLAGVFSTFKDNVDLALGGVGKQLNETLNLTGSLEKFTGVIKRMGEAFVRFSQNNPKLSKFLIIMAGVLAVLGPLAVGIGILGAVFSTAFAPVTLIVLGIAALIAAGVLLAENWDVIKEVISNTIDSVVETVKTGFNFVMDMIKKAGRFIAENNPFSVMVKMLGFLIQKITGFDILSFLPDKLRSFIGLDVEAPGAGGGAAESGLATAGAENNVTDININLSDREGLVEKVVSSSRRGRDRTRVGRNM